MGVVPCLLNESPGDAIQGWRSSPPESLARNSVRSAIALASCVDDVELDQPPVGAAAHPSQPHHDGLERDGTNRSRTYVVLFETRSDTRFREFANATECMLLFVA